jgi:hypothetical protein
MSFNQTKSAFASLTIQASAVSALATILAAFGVNIAPDALPHLNAIVAGVASVVAIYGRIRAHTLIE